MIRKRPPRRPFSCRRFAALWPPEQRKRCHARREETHRRTSSTPAATIHRMHATACRRGAQRGCSGCFGPFPTPDRAPPGL